MSLDLERILDSPVVSTPRPVSDFAFERRVWILHCIAGVSPSEVAERTGGDRARVDGVFASLRIARWTTRQGLECVIARELDSTIGSSTVGRMESFVEQRQERLRELLRRTPEIPWERLESFHIEQFGRLLIHMTLRSSLAKQLDALRWGERWGSTERARNAAWRKRHTARRPNVAASHEIATLLDAPRKFVVAHLRGVEEGHRYHADLTSAALTWMPWMLGRAEWPGISPTDTFGALPDWQDAQQSARDGMLHIAAENKVDLAALDSFVADVQRLVEKGCEEEERLTRIFEREGAVVASRSAATPGGVSTAASPGDAGLANGIEPGGSARHNSVGNHGKLSGPPDKRMPRGTRLAAGITIVSLLVLLGMGCQRTEVVHLDVPQADRVLGCPPPARAMPTDVHVGLVVQSPIIVGRIDDVIARNNEFQLLRTRMVEIGFAFAPGPNNYVTARDSTGVPLVGFSYSAYRRDARSAAFLVSLYPADLSTSTVEPRYTYMTVLRYFQAPAMRYWVDGTTIGSCEEPRSVAAPEGRP